MEDSQQNMHDPHQHPEPAVGSKILSIPKPGPGAGALMPAHPGIHPQAQWLDLVLRPQGMGIMGGCLEHRWCSLVLSAARRKMLCCLRAEGR